MRRPGWRYPALLSFVLVVHALSSTGALAGNKPWLALCVDDERAEKRAFVHLRRWLPTVRLTLRPRRCDASWWRYRGWFESERGQVYFVLKDEDGTTTRRHVPWISRTDGVLSRLAARSRLSEYSILVQWLLVERHNDGLSPTRAPTARQGADEPGTVGLFAPPTRQEAAHQEGRAREAAGPESPGARRESPRGVRHQPEPRLPGSRRPRRLAQQRGPDQPTIPAVHRALRSPLAPVVDVLGELTVGAHLTGRWRLSNLWSMEVGGDLRWRSLFFRGGYQPSVEWDLEGEPVSVGAFFLSLGWRPTVWARRPWRLVGQLALLAERSSVRRVGIDGAREHGFWDLGGALGAGVALSLPAGLETGVSLGTVVFPLGRVIEIPDGPSARLNGVDFRSSLLVSWSFPG